MEASFSDCCGFCLWKKYSETLIYTIFFFCFWPDQVGTKSYFFYLLSSSLSKGKPPPEIRTVLTLHFPTFFAAFSSPLSLFLYSRPPSSHSVSFHNEKLIESPSLPLLSSHRRRFLSSFFYGKVYKLLLKKEAPFLKQTALQLQTHKLKLKKYFKWPLQGLCRYSFNSLSFLILRT